LLPQYIIVGIFIGFLAGLFGIGGSIISTPILKVIFGLPSLIALATPLPVTIPAAIAGVYGFLKRDLVNKRIAFYVIISGLPATIIGAWATQIVSGTLLMVLTGVFVIIVGIRLFYNSKLKETPPTKEVPIVVFSVLTGLATGFCSGLLAVGGGIIMIPAFLLVFGLPVQEAIATSLFSIIFFAIPGTLVHWHMHHIDWLLVLNISIGVIPASYLGAKVAMQIKSQKLLMFFSIFLITFGVYFILSQTSIL
jgi:hypothetical protein